jgi:hypothetical protein
MVATVFLSSPLSTQCPEAVPCVSVLIFRSQEDLLCRCMSSQRMIIWISYMRIVKRLISRKTTDPRATCCNERFVKRYDLLDFQVQAAISLGVATGSPPSLYLPCCLPSVKLSDELTWLIDYLEFRSWSWGWSRSDFGWSSSERKGRERGKGNVRKGWGKDSDESKQKGRKKQTSNDMNDPKESLARLMAQGSVQSLQRMFPSAAGSGLVSCRLA